MGKSKRDYRRDSADNFEPYVPTETRGNYGMQPKTPRDTFARHGRSDGGDDFGGRRRRPPRQPREKIADPVAIEIAKVFADQAREFLAAPAEERPTAANALFRLAERPMELDLGQDQGDTTKFYVYDVDRSVRVDRNEPERLRHMSAAFVVNSNDSVAPAYFAYARITPEGNFNVRVIPQGDKGPDYRSSAIIDSRDDASNSTQAGGESN